jgi:hypothetical protein
VESVHHGEIPFDRTGKNEITLKLPLEASDWLMITTPPNPR